jgi:hypothetical protein
VRDLVAGAPVKHMDETGFRIGGKRWQRCNRHACQHERGASIHEFFLARAQNVNGWLF